MNVPIQGHKVLLLHLIKLRGEVDEDNPELGIRELVFNNNNNNNKLYLYSTFQNKCYKVLSSKNN